MYILKGLPLHGIFWEMFTLSNNFFHNSKPFVEIKELTKGPEEEYSRSLFNDTSKNE